MGEGVACGCVQSPFLRQFVMVEFTQQHRTSELSPSVPSSCLLSTGRSRNQSFGCPWLLHLEPAQLSQHLALAWQSVQTLSLTHFCPLMPIMFLSYQARGDVWAVASGASLPSHFVELQCRVSPREGAWPLLGSFSGERQAEQQNRSNPGRGPDTLS